LGVEEKKEQYPLYNEKPMEHPLKQFQHAFIDSAYLLHPRDGGVRS
jgi:hypothetical protein